MNKNDTNKKLKYLVIKKEGVKSINVIQYGLLYISNNLESLGYTLFLEQCGNERAITKMTVRDISLGGSCYEH